MSVKLPFQIWSVASSASCACGQPGFQSPSVQPISELWLPGTLTLSGWVTGPTPPELPPPPAGAGVPTTPYDEAADTLPLLSLVIARYSSRVPLARPVTSSKTRYGALSSVPRTRQLLVPTGRVAKVTWAKAFSVRAAEISAALTENAFAQVTFATRPVGTSSWRVLSTDDNAPYRVLDDVTGRAKGTLLEYRAITKDSSGNVSAASSYGVVGDPAPAGGGGGGASGRSPSPTMSACPEATTRRWVALATGSRTARRRSWHSTPRTRSGRASSAPFRRVTTSTRPRSTRAGTRTTAQVE